MFFTIYPLMYQSVYEIHLFYIETIWKLEIFEYY